MYILRTIDVYAYLMRIEFNWHEWIFCTDCIQMYVKDSVRTLRYDLIECFSAHVYKLCVRLAYVHVTPVFAHCTVHLEQLDNPA